MNDQQARIRWKLRPPLGRDHCKGCVGGQRGGDKFMTVTMVAANGEERFSRRSAPAVDRKARY
jgi:hypothetical protein